MSETPRTDAWARQGAYMNSGDYADVGHKQFIHIDNCRTLERELTQAQFSAEHRKHLLDGAIYHREKAERELAELKRANEELRAALKRVLSVDGKRGSCLYADAYHNAIEVLGKSGNA